MTILLGLWWGIDGGKKASGVVICGPPQTLCGVYGENDTTDWITYKPQMEHVQLMWQQVKAYEYCIWLYL